MSRSIKIDLNLSRMGPDVKLESDKKFKSGSLHEVKLIVEATFYPKASGLIDQKYIDRVKEALNFEVEDVWYRDTKDGLSVKYRSGWIDTREEEENE